MEILSHHDLLGLNSAIREIYTARDVDSYYRSIFSAIQTIIPGELCSFNDFTTHPVRFLNGIQGSQDHRHVYDQLRPTFSSSFHDHPLNPHYFSNNVVKTTDYVSKHHFKITTIYNEYYKHLDVETQIGFSIPLSKDKSSLFVLSRKKPDFSERDRLILILLKPHLIGALRNVEEHNRMILERDLMQKGAEQEKQGAVLFQSDGMILSISPFAKKMLTKYFDTTLVEGNTLPKRLLNWFKTLGYSKRKVEQETFTFEKEDNSLLVKLINDFTTGDYILVITESDPTSTLCNLREYDLSRRETEVLTWLSKGKTNVEIAMILSISKRTAEKHMENIFVKLGVETRAAAAAVIRQ